MNSKTVIDLITPPGSPKPTRLSEGCRSHQLTSVQDADPLQSAMRLCEQQAPTLGKQNVPALEQSQLMRAQTGQNEEDDKVKDIAELLSSWRLDCYTKAFATAGYDDLEIIQALNADDIDELISTIGMKIGHGKKFKKWLLRLTSRVPAAPSPPIELTSRVDSQCEMRSAEALSVPMGGMSAVSASGTCATQEPPSWWVVPDFDHKFAELLYLLQMPPHNADHWVFSPEQSPLTRDCFPQQTTEQLFCAVHYVKVQGQSGGRIWQHYKALKKGTAKNQMLANTLNSPCGRPKRRKVRNRHSLKVWVSSVSGKSLITNTYCPLLLH